MNLKEAMIGWNKVEIIRSNQSTGEVKEDEKVNGRKQFVACRLRKSQNGWASDVYARGRRLDWVPSSSFSGSTFGKFQDGTKKDNNVRPSLIVMPWCFPNPSARLSQVSTCNVLRVRSRREVLYRSSLSVK